MLRKKIVIFADDNTNSRNLVEEILKNHNYFIKTFINGRELVEYVKKGRVPDCILLDIDMPVLNGINTSKRLREIKNIKQVPIIAVSGKIDNRTYESLFNNNFYEVVKKPFQPEILVKKVKNAIDASEHISYRQFEYTVLLTFANLEELRDKTTSGHNKRLGSMIWDFAKALDKSDEFCNCIKNAVTLHDIGKMAVPEAILNKEGSLSNDEFLIIKRHPKKGHEILNNLANQDIDSLKMAQEIALKHHEKLDGTGYPHGIKGDEIPIYVKMATILDIYDAFTMKRPYHPSRTHEEGMECLKMEVENNKIDAKLFEAFKSISQKIKIFKRTTNY